MEKQLVRISLPEVKLTIDGESIVMMRPVTVEVSSVKEIVQAIKQRTPRNDIYFAMKRKIIAALEKGVDLELADGTVVTAPMHHRSGWQFEIPISKSSINKAAGRHVPVTYANFVHNGLYKIQRIDRFNVSTKARATLTSLGYIDTSGEITSEGHNVLEKLSEINPVTDPSCRMKLARAIFYRYDPTLPAFDFASDNGYIHLVTTETEPREPWYIYDYIRGPAIISRWDNETNIVNYECWYPTKRGAEWLEANAKKILSHHSCSRTRRIDMIPFMPLGHLNEYLASDVQGVRLVADRRLQVFRERGEAS